MPSVTEQCFDPNCPHVVGYVLSNSSGATVHIINLGARVSAVCVPNKHGDLVDVVLGEDSVRGYELNPWYMGCTVGRVAGRISHGHLDCGSREITLTRNCGPHHLHGGSEGFDRKLWTSCVRDQAVTFTHVSPDGEENYPGLLICHVTYRFTDAGCLSIEYVAVSDRTTPVNLTNHSYWNLAGHSAGRSALRRHEVRVNADCVLEADEQCMVTGGKLPVQNTAWDLRETRLLGEAIDQLGSGFDHFLCFAERQASSDTRDSKEMAVLDLPVSPRVRQVADVSCPQSGITMTVFSDQPGMQFYTGNFLEERDIASKQSAVYASQAGFCMETQGFPDAVNNSHFPSILLHPGQCYQQHTIYRFSVQSD